MNKRDAYRFFAEHYRPSLGDLLKSPVDEQEHKIIHINLLGTCTLLNTATSRQLVISSSMAHWRYRWLETHGLTGNEPKEWAEAWTG